MDLAVFTLSICEGGYDPRLELVSNLRPYLEKDAYAHVMRDGREVVVIKMKPTTFSYYADIDRLYDESTGQFINEGRWYEVIQFTPFEYRNLSEKIAKKIFKKGVTKTLDEKMVLDTLGNVPEGLDV